MDPVKPLKREGSSSQLLCLFQVYSERSSVQNSTQ